LLGKVLAHQSIMTLSGSELNQSDAIATAEAIAMQSLTLLTRLSEVRETGIPLLILGEIALLVVGNFEKAAQLTQEALTRFTENGDQWRMGQTLANLGMISFTIGNYPEAIQYYQRGVTLCEAIGNLTWLGDNLNRMGEVYKALGQLEQAKASAQAALAARTAAGNKRGIAWSHQLLADVAWRMGDYVTAQQHAEESLALFQQLGLTKTQGVTLNILGSIACSLGDYPQAKAYFRHVVESHLGSSGTLHWMVFVALVGWATVLIAEEESASAVELLIHTVESPIAWQETKDRAAKLLAELETKLPPSLFAAAQVKAHSQALQTVLTTLLMTPGQQAQ
jgi:tetratricopeptide (TPR) repeat protein